MSSSSSSRIANATLPTRFKCRICDKFKLVSSFSNKELNTFRFQIGSGQKVDSVSAQLRCRDCSGAPASKLQCCGPCNLTKPLAEFSKSQRRNFEEPWCKDCVMWRESVQPGVEVMPPPETVLTYDEKVRMGGVRNSLTSRQRNEDDDGTVVTYYAEDNTILHEERFPNTSHSENADTQTTASYHTAQETWSTIGPHGKQKNFNGWVQTTRSQASTVGSITSPGTEGSTCDTESGGVFFDARSVASGTSFASAVKSGMAASTSQSAQNTSESQTSQTSWESSWQASAPWDANVMWGAEPAEGAQLPPASDWPMLLPSESQGPRAWQTPQTPRGGMERGYGRQGRSSRGWGKGKE